MSTLPKNAPLRMVDMFPAHKDESTAFDLLSKMLEFLPTRRITIEKALEHPFLASLHNVEDEPTANFTFSFDFEHEDLPSERVRSLIWDELRTYHTYLSETHPGAGADQQSRRKGPGSGPGLGGILYFRNKL